jgi:hypothetical protein
VFTLFKRSLLVAAFALAALPAFAVPATIASRTGGYVGQWTAGGVGGQAQYTSFTTSSAYSGVSITAPICSFTGSATGRVWLTNGIGGGATVIAGPATFTTSANCVAAVSAPTTVFSGVTLPAASTYYLIFDDQSDANFAIVYSTGAGSPAVAESGTVGADFYASTYNAANVPASTWTAITSPSRGILFSAAGTAGLPPGSTGVPTLGTFAMVGTVMLLGVSGLLFLKRESANPLR